MSEIERTLTQKIGPLPVWAWLLIGGVGVYLVAKFLPGLLGTSKVNTAQTPPLSTPTPTTENAGAQLAQEIGLLQQLQGYNSAAYQNSLQQVQQTQQLGSTLTPSLSPGTSATVQPPGVSAPITSTPGSPSDKADQHIIGYVTGGAIVNVQGNATTGYWSNGQYTAVPIGYAGQNGYINAINIQPLPETHQFGGPRGRVGQAHPVFHGGHQALKTKVYMPHYAAGGPRDLATIAMQTGIHPARLMAANGHLRHQDYKAAPGQVIRIA